MPALTPPPPSPTQGAIKANGIWVTHVIEQTIEQTRFDVNELIRIPLSNNSWRSCYVPTDQIELKNSDWDQIKSVEGICVVGKCCNGKFYEVAVHESYIPWLLLSNFKFEPYIDFERAKPADAEERVYGVLAARRRAQSDFLENALNAIWSRRDQGLKSYFRRIAPSQLQTSLECAIIDHDILESPPQVRKKYAQFLSFIALNLVKDYDTPSVIKLLQKDQDELLEAFRKDYADLLKAAPEISQQTAEFHRISLRRRLLVFAGGKDDFRQRKVDPKYTADDNANFYGSLVGITGSNRFGSFDPQELCKALSRSKVFANDDHVLDIASLTSQMMASLPIGPAPEPSGRFSDQYWVRRIKDRVAHKVAPEIPKHAVPKPSLWWYNWWTFVPVVLLAVSILRGLEASLVWRIFLISTCGESFTLLKYIRLRRRIAQQPDQWALIAHTSLCILKITFTSMFFCVGWTTGGDLTLIVLLSISTIYALRILFCRIYYSRAQSSRDEPRATWHRVQDLEKGLDVDMGHQYLRKGDLAEFYRKFDCESYTFVRLSNLESSESEDIFEKLDKVGRLHQIASVLQLPDESWEMVVLKSYLSELESRLGKIFPGCHVDPNYDPTEPSRDDIRNSRLPSQSGGVALMVAEDVKRFYIEAKILKIHASSSRAMTMIKEAWPIAAAYYSCLLERNTAWLKENAQAR